MPIPRRGSASSCSPRRSGRGSLLDVGCGSGVLSIAAARLGFAPVTALDNDPVAVETTRANATRQRGGCGGGYGRRGSRDPLPSADLAVANVLLAPVEALLAPTRGDLARSPPATSPPTRPRAPRWTQHRPAGVGRMGGRPPRPGRGRADRSARFDRLSSWARMATFSTRLPRLQGLVRRRTGDPRAPARRRPRRGCEGGEIQVVNTLLRHPRGRLEVAAGRSARGPHRAHRLRDGLRLAARGRVRQRSGNVVVTGRTGDEAAAFVAGDVGALGCVNGRAPASTGRGLREDPGRLLVLLRLLRDPARPRRDAKPAGRGRALRDPAPRRPGPPRDRPHGCQPRLLPRPRRGLHPRAPRARGRRGDRASSGSGSPRSRSTTSTTSSLAALRETPTVSPHLHVPLQSGDDGVLRAMGRRYTAARRSRAGSSRSTASTSRPT